MENENKMENEMKKLENGTSKKMQKNREKI